jgi:hypothetical protein
MEAGPTRPFARAGAPEKWDGRVAFAVPGLLDAAREAQDCISGCMT